MIAVFLLGASLEQAQKLIDSGDYQGAITELEAFVEGYQEPDPDPLYKAYLMMGIAYYKMGDREKAIEMLGKVRGTHYPEALYWLDKVLKGLEVEAPEQTEVPATGTEQGDPLKVLKALIEVKKEHARIYSRAAEIFRKAGLEEEARKYEQKAKQLRSEVVDLEKIKAKYSSSSAKPQKRTQTKSQPTVSKEKQEKSSQ